MCYSMGLISSSFFKKKLTIPLFLCTTHTLIRDGGIVDLPITNHFWQLLASCGKSPVQEACLDVAFEYPYFFSVV